MIGFGGSEKDGKVGHPPMAQADASLKSRKGPPGYASMQTSNQINLNRREYGLTGYQRGVYLFYAAMLIGFGLFFWIKIPDGGLFVLVINAVTLSGAFAVVALALRSRLVLQGDWVELRSLVRTFRANRNEIAGLRRIRNQYGAWTRIYRKDGGHGMDVSNAFTGDDDFKQWSEGLPDLDRQDADTITRQLGNQNSSGTAWTIGLSVAAGIVCLPVAFVSDPAVHGALVLLSLLVPPIGVLLIRRLPLLFTVFRRKPDPRADVTALFIWPPIAIVMSYSTGADPTHLIDFGPLMWWGTVVLIFWGAAAFPIAWQSPSRMPGVALLTIFGLLYSLGIVHAADVLPDASATHIYTTKVLRTYESHGRTTSYYIRLAPFGPEGYSADADVSPAVYRQTHVGDQICVRLHSGFLHAAWYTLVPCRKAPDFSTGRPQ
jgi:hypothetical protein